jgi:uncharacterized protein DUF3168
MTLEVDLFTALKSLVGNRVAPATFPQPPTVPVWPAIRYTFISNVPVLDICGDGDDETSEPRVQLDIVALTFKDVRALRLQVMAAMRLFVPPAILENTLSEYDAETQTFREIMDYSFHGSSASVNSPP